jgi:hypothetical protein
LFRLYKWRNPKPSRTFFLATVAAVFLLVFVPFRFIFPLIGETAEC